MSSADDVRVAREGAILEVTIDRPKANAIDGAISRRLGEVFAGFRDDPELRVAIVTGAGEKFFSAGWDLKAIAKAGSHDMDFGVGGFGGLQELPGLNKPVIAAVNGMACGGAFYMLGEVEFIVAAEHATFFDPHVTYGMTASFEPIHMSGITPFCEIMRLSLLGNYERMSAQRAYQVGMVSEVVPGAELSGRARELAAIIASQPKLAIEGTVRAIWSTREMPQREAVRLGYAYVAMGTNQDSIAEGQKLFSSGKRVEWKLR
jgi:enoyl-CoA hydratase/carnithine racemase